MKAFLFSLFACLLSVHVRAENPLTEFYSKTRCKTKVVIITLDLAGCNNCIAPMDHILNKLKSANSSLPVYILLNDQLSKPGELIYSTKNNIDTALVKYMYDAVLHNYLITKTDHTPNIAVVSAAGKILTLENLKTGDLGKIDAAMRPEMKLVLTKKTTLKNPYISLNKTYSGIQFYENSFYVFVQSMGMLSKYNKHGDNLRNFFIDSLDLDYARLSKALFDAKDYASSKLYCQKQRLKKEALMTPVSLMKMGEGRLGINFQLHSYQDSLVGKDEVTLERSYSFVVVIDTAFKLVSVLKFQPAQAKEIELHCQGIYSDSVFYFLKVDPGNKNGAYQVGEFKQKGQELFLVREYPQPFIPNRHYFLEMLSNAGGAAGTFYLSYTAVNSKKTRLYKRSQAMGGYLPEVCIKGLSAEGWQIYETKKGNYVFLENTNKDSFCRAYDVSKQKLLVCEEGMPQSGEENSTGNKLYFLTNGCLYEVSYKE